MPDAPRNSLGQPWTGQTWRCVLCPATGSVDAATVAALVRALPWQKSGQRP